MPLKTGGPPFSLSLVLFRHDIDHPGEKMDHGFRAFPTLFVAVENTHHKAEREN